MEGINSFSTDGYQFTMAYSYFFNGMKDKLSTNQFFFRKNPFNINYCILGGTHLILKAIKEFDYSLDDVNYIKKILNLSNEDPFLDYLWTYDSNLIEIDFIEEGTLVLPHEPLITIKGPIIWNTLIEDRIMNLLNFPTLIATNAFRIKNLIKEKTFLELGFRRGMGPNGANIGSLYAYIGGTDGSSNMNMVKKYDLFFDGSMSHAFVLSFSYVDDLNKIKNLNSNKELNIIIDEVIKLRNKLGYLKTNLGELASFILFYTTFKNKLYCLLDTYDVYESGLKNFMLVAHVTEKLGCEGMVLRIDSEDLLENSSKIRTILNDFDKENKSNISKTTKIFVTNKIEVKDIEIWENEKNIEMNKIDIYGMGTKLITCFEQPFLGIVSKQICLNGVNSLKLDANKIMLPFVKNCYRLTLENDEISDLITLKEEKIEYIKSFYLLNDNKEYKLDIKTYYKLNNNKLEKNVHKIKSKVSSIRENLKDVVNNKYEIKIYFSNLYIEKYNELKKKLEIN